MAAIYGYKWTNHLGIVADDNGNLTEAAKTWQAGLKGLTTIDMGVGFRWLITEYAEWPPSLPRFRELCFKKNSENIPSLDKVISILTTVLGKKGSVATRYQHPLIYAISQQIDMHGLRMANFFDGRKIVKQTYDDFIAHGYPDFSEHAYIDPLAITHTQKPADKNLGRNALHALREKL